MTKKEKVLNGLEHCSNRSECTDECHYSPIIRSGMDECVTLLCKDALDVIEEQQAEIERLKAEKANVIKQIESEIQLLRKERACVHNSAERETYNWLINGYQGALDMIKEGEQE